MSLSPANAHAADRAPHDERGTPDDQLMRCETHGVIHRRWGRCLDCVRAAVEGDR
ncbi:hypothetical protein Hbl1158_02825 [Halobaculum sp. CBA1158]|uniref:hypothetical protein n=1 Tax=Halobaculum sp. CBA1158 TaxID=2904243 RepID=UPI001F23A51A|nr:hypothetical protein [Halobaculum sp. CBA1158]UIP00320.1 hypothetical protein Hbl1158_02825 [Halobaculum sp. CBA1158]